MSDQATHLRLALHRVWDEIAPHTYKHLAKHTLTAEEVRAAVLMRLGEESSANVNIKKFWTELTDPQKRHALADAFPHGPYPQRAAEDTDIRDDGVFG
jgi:hypothetical protein